MILLVYSSLNEDGHQRLPYLNVHSLGGGTVWEGLEDVALLEEVCTRGGLGFSKAHSRLALYLQLRL